jgi:hypothetical protein
MEKSLGQVLELDLREVPNQNSSRSTHALEHDTAQSCIDFLAARGLETIQPLFPSFSLGIYWGSCRPVPRWKVGSVEGSGVQGEEDGGDQMHG